MRICYRCSTEMLKGFDIKVEGGAYGIKVSKGTGPFAQRIGKPKVAICPKCGEISLFIENIKDILQARE